MESFDLVVIGAGPGGYVAAIRAAQYGKKVAIVEKEKVGGTCLHVGCIPSKSFLEHSHWMSVIQSAKDCGIDVQVKGIDFQKLVARKQQIVDTLGNGIQQLFQKNRIQYFHGKARVARDRSVVVGNQTLRGAKILLATGSHPFVPGIQGIEAADYVTTDQFFDQSRLANKLVIIGGGVIAVELACAMAPLGVKTTLVEIAPDILLTEDSEARMIVKKSLQQMGVKVRTNATISQVRTGELVVDGENICFDQLLVAAGRKADLEVAENLQLQLTENNKFLKVNQRYETPVKGIYAVGDLIGGLQLAHTASEEGIKAVENMFDFQTKQSSIIEEQIPKCVYSFPEIASIGLSEVEAKSIYRDVQIKKIPFASNGKALASKETLGFVKLICRQKYNEILGAVVVGSHATEMIHIVGSMMAAEGTAEELATQIFAHPTMSEAIGEAAKGIVFRAIHE